MKPPDSTHHENTDFQSRDDHSCEKIHSSSGYQSDPKYEEAVFQAVHNCEKIHTQSVKPSDPS